MEEKARKGYLKEACKANIEEVYMEEVREACMNFQRPRIYASSIILALKAWELVLVSIILFLSLYILFSLF